MQDRLIRTLTLAGNPAMKGTSHGVAHAREIRDFAEKRLELSAAGTALDREALLALAERCLPAHRDYAPDLYEEMEAMAGAAGLSPSEAMVLGGYTDFLDLVRAHHGSPRIVDECTAVVVPDGSAADGGFLAQTWDMDASATSHVVMLHIAAEEGPSALIFSTVGCLGQIGMNEAGIAVGINNLSAADGRVGVTWPFVVRKALQQTAIGTALECILEADLAGGHNFVLFDSTGTGYGVEAMPTASQVTPLGDHPLIHTNHCLAAATRAVEAARPQDLQLSSERRLSDAAGLLASPPVTEEMLMAMTRDEAWICRRPAPPWFYETCGAVIMRPHTGDLWACWGIPADNEYEHFTLEPSQV